LSNAITTIRATQIFESVATFVGTRFERLLLLLLLPSLAYLLTAASLAPFHSSVVTKTGIQEAATTTTTMQCNFLTGKRKGKNQ